MDKPDRDRLRKLIAEASSAPWEPISLNVSEEPGATEKDRFKSYVARTIDLGGDLFAAVLCQKPDGSADVCHTGNGPTSGANAFFIAAARTALPSLLAALEEAEARVKVLEKLSGLQDRLLSAYRLGKHPGGALLDDLAATRERLAALTPRDDARKGT